MATEDLCAVCADSLDYTGFGPCGHKDACSRCVARLRFVMNDTKCMICKQDAPSVLFTRFMGDFTESLAPQEFADLRSRSQAGELFELPEVGGYFDDQEHFKTIKCAACNNNIPTIDDLPGAGAAFGSLSTLKRRLQDAHQLHFCDLCVKGRQVFVSEQVLYSKADLERHCRTGDDAGPLADSGFRGHPSCRFCRQRFYDSDELYKHMEGRHEHCFICRRHNPSRFVYFRDYAELEGHFTSDHHPCPHPACLERKFVVFSEEAELKRHFATEHGSELNMSRAQRRQALSLNIQLQYASSSREQQEANLPAADAAAAAAARPGVVIGGGHNLPQRRGGMRHSRSEGAVAASLETHAAETAARAAAAAAAAGPSSVAFSADDFPSVSGGSGGRSSTAPLGTWVGGSAPGNSGLSQDDFPALPTQSRNQRRRARERERTAAASMAARLAPAAAPVRVVNRAVASAGAAAAPVPSTTSEHQMMRHSNSTGSLAPGVGSISHEDVTDVTARVSSDDADAFPALPGAPGAASQAHPAWMPVRRSGKPRPGAAGAAGATTAAQVLPSVAEFPTLAASQPARQRGGGASGGAAAQQKSQRLPVASASSSGSAPGSNVSEQLKAANKALVERCRAALSEDAFQTFRSQSAAFMSGGMSADTYHAHVMELGLQQLVPQMAALCPHEDRRVALLSVHRTYVENGQNAAPPKGEGRRGWVPPEAALAALQESEALGSWPCERCTLVNMPRCAACEACAAPRPRLQLRSAQTPSTTSRASGPMQSQWGGTAPATAAATLAAAGTAGAQAGPSATGFPSSSSSSRPSGETWPTLPGACGSRAAPVSTTAASSSSSAKVEPAAAGKQPQVQGKKGNKGTKHSLQELLSSGKTHPQNAWSQTARLGDVVAPPASGRASLGKWGKAGGTKLANKINALNDAGWSG